MSGAGGITPQFTMPVKVFPGVSDDFVKLNKKYYKDIPDGIKKLLNDGGYEFQIGQKVTQVMPDLKGVHPRGWPKGSTWDSCEGLHHESKKKIMNCETNRPIGKKEFIKNTRPENIFKHETGHAADVVLKNFSSTEEFAVGYRKDVAKLTKEQKQKYSYLLQKGSAGKQEAFAEIFSDLIGGKGWAKASGVFPNTAKIVKKKIGL